MSKTIPFLLLLLTSVAHAEARPMKEEARQLLVDGNSYYQVRDFDQAIELYKKGAIVEAAPVFWYNLGQAFRQQGKYKEAIWYYKRYLADPDSEAGRGHAEHFVEEMQRELDRRAQTETPVEPAPTAVAKPEPAAPPLVPVAPVASPVERRWYQDKVGWVLVGTGAVVAAAGVYSIAHAGALEDSAYGRPSVLDDAHTFRLAGIGLTAVGSAVVLSGVVKFALSRRHPAAAPVVTAAPTTRGFALGLSGRF